MCVVVRVGVRHRDGIWVGLGWVGMGWVGCAKDADAVIVQCTPRPDALVDRSVAATLTTGRWDLGARRGVTQYTASPWGLHRYWVCR